MRFIPTRIHGMLDYLMGALLIATPWIFDFARGGAETWVPVILGASVILYSIFTDYELGAVRRISMRTHLWLDILGGAFLAVSPWLFDFNEWVYMPHLLLGLAEVGAGIFTRTTPDRVHTPTAVHEADRSRTGYTDRTDVNNTTAVSRPPMGSNAETRTRTESDRIRKDL